ncbi:unnamed protein product [Cylicostephanus goldi]|uniref:Uncharacterized protein n=1 Tax=Cylicostephanus goldi TaxID=71465 RepID=A0A3P6S960_CYLGO|nr:unnamed protein product [Cylicostephanus goldi]
MNAWDSPLGDADVAEVPGIGPTYATALRARGFDKVWAPLLVHYQNCVSR